MPAPARLTPEPATASPTFALATVAGAVLGAPLAIHVLRSAGLVPAAPNGALPLEWLFISGFLAVMAVLCSLSAAARLGRGSRRNGPHRKASFPQENGTAEAATPEGAASTPEAPQRDVLLAIAELHRETSPGATPAPLGPVRERIRS